MIRRWIEDLHPTGLGDWPVRVCREELHALPLYGNGVDLWAIRPDGVILCLDLDSVRHAADPETGRDRVIRAIVEGAKQYPELLELLPNDGNTERPDR